MMSAAMKSINFYRRHGGHVVRVADEQGARKVLADRAIYAPKLWPLAVRLIELQVSE